MFYCNYIILNTNPLKTSEPSTILRFSQRSIINNPRIFPKLVNKIDEVQSFYYVWEFQVGYPGKISCKNAAITMTTSKIIYDMLNKRTGSH